jgi:hypothetical protein
MTTYHTPGPWKAHTLPNGSHHIVADHWNASVAVTMFPESGSEGREANAKLIASAPSMLEALEWVLATLNQPEAHKQALEMAQRAVEAARG